MRGDSHLEKDYQFLLLFFSSNFFFFFGGVGVGVGVGVAGGGYQKQSICLFCISWRR